MFEYLSDVTEWQAEPLAELSYDCIAALEQQFIDLVTDVFLVYSEERGMYVYSTVRMLMI